MVVGSRNGDDELESFRWTRRKCQAKRRDTRFLRAGILDGPFFLSSEDLQPMTLCDGMLLSRCGGREGGKEEENETCLT